MNKIELSDAAKTDIADIAAYTFSRYGQQQAVTYTHSIYQRLQMLYENPNLGHRRDDLPESFKAYPARCNTSLFTK